MPERNYTRESWIIRRGGKRFLNSLYPTGANVIPCQDPGSRGWQVVPAKVHPQVGKRPERIRNLIYMGKKLSAYEIDIAKQLLTGITCVEIGRLRGWKYKTSGPVICKGIIRKLGFRTRLEYMAAAIQRLRKQISEKS